MRYIRVKDKQTGHRYDVLLKQFNPEKHTEVKSGPYKGESDRPRRVQLNTKTKRASASTTSGEPSGETNEKKED